MTRPTPNHMPDKVLANVREGLPTFDELYAAGIEDITTIFHQIRWEEEGIPDDTAAAILAVGVYQVNAPEPHQEDA